MLFKGSICAGPLNKAVSFNENHLVCQEQVGAKQPVSFIPSSNLKNLAINNSVQLKTKCTLALQSKDQKLTLDT